MPRNTSVHLLSLIRTVTLDVDGGDRNRKSWLKRGWVGRGWVKRSRNRFSVEDKKRGNHKNDKQPVENYEGLSYSRNMK